MEYKLSKLLTISKITGIEFKDYASQYFDSEYANGFFLHNSGKPLPDYET